MKAGFASSSQPPLICHVVYRLDFGGLENGLVNLINRLPRDRMRHAVIALTEATDFADRIDNDAVQVYSLDKRPGKDPAFYFRLFRLLRRLRPAAVHTRNLGTLDCQLVAWLAGVPVRIHGEHGWDVHDPGGTTPRYVRLRRTMDRFVHRYVALSGEIERWLNGRVGVDDTKITRICNGVDSDRFTPGAGPHPGGRLTVGTVIRFSEIKDPFALVEALPLLLERLPEGEPVPRLLLVGDGPLLGAVEQRIRDEDMADHVMLAGAQRDVVPWLRQMDVFVLASKREGISNTILEAMSCGLPVIATNTGGNPELVADPGTGTLVPVGDRAALADAIANLVEDPERLRRAGSCARHRVLERFSLNAMVEAYLAMYDRELRSNH